MTGTILYLSLVYVFGTIMLSFSSIIHSMIPYEQLSLLALLMIAIGTGGIKPCVSSFGGDQFVLPHQELQLRQFFSIFYFSINIGSLLSTLFTPVMRKNVKCFDLETCFPLAFETSSALMVIATEDLVNFMRKAESVEASLQTFFATGNLVSNSGLGLQQDKGLTIMVENISRMRYMSHFRGVHRGSVFEQMRMTEPRQLLPDAWGFICPVHTPDGTPCGLLNHLARTCEVADAPKKKLLDNVPLVLASLGMKPITEAPLPSSISSWYFSNLCNLKNLSPEELIKRGEHEEEWGGYFIVKGNERLIRMLLNTRRNYPVAVKRSSWKSRDTNFSDIGILIRCVSEDETALNNVLHYLTDGTAKLMISYRKSLYYVPIILIMKCLVDYTDEFIYQHLIAGFEDDLYFKGCIMEMMRSLHENNIHNHSEACKYMGNLFRVKFYELPPWTTDEEVTQFIMQRCVLIHLKNNTEKFHVLVVMLQKLFRVVQGHSLIENPDSIMFQELLLGGHLYLKILKEKLQTWLYIIKAIIVKSDKLSFDLTEKDLVNFMRKAESVEASLQTFFATGNLVSNSGLGLQQDKGLTIMVENISRMRYMSHFRGVHRGSVFEQMRMTEPRQLLPDAWGFICPVHTPDGTPCGLLNHLARTCEVADAPKRKLLDNVPLVLASLGMKPITEAPLPSSISSWYFVMLDGKIIGHVMEKLAESLVAKLRLLKIVGKKVPKTLEIILLARKSSETITQFPGIYLFTGNARMMRPVINLAAGELELIGTFEQVYLDISICPEETILGVTTHQELSKSDFLSFAASLIPMPDYNQSPRNMYQCQMGKQTMGTACHNWQLISDTKLYRLQTPTTPLFRPIFHDFLKIDDFPMGTNAIVAVISYTGYDMEDAMIINQASLDRGFAHGSIYKCDTIELKPNTYFALDLKKEELCEKLDKDGLPFVGRRLKPDDIYYSYYDPVMQSYSLGKYTGKEEVFIDTVRLCGDFVGDKSSVQKACIVFRITRNPSVGDKFASRAGQKGIFSLGYKPEDLPFTESGLVPDIVFNPHGFPSRMTIAMMIECMAGKTASLHGLVHDASPFQYSEEDTAINYFGELLQAGGYNYYGDEIMYSGIDGTEMPASIFFGVVHYQRLRHMVSDKWQVRNTGPVDILTRQPLKGRKRGGGGRVGEMERDALISHGTPYLIQDRFTDCSDKSTAFLCHMCKTLVGPTIVIEKSSDGHNVRRNVTVCKICNDSKQIQEIGIPYIFRYLSAELASVNIKLKFNVDNDNSVVMYT